jgi:hypothetical protein
MFTNFYHGLIRKTVISFGTLFNNIYINRTDGANKTQKIKVPLIYSPKEIFMQKLALSFANLENQAVQITLPRMSFAITNIQYDPERKKNSINKRYKETVSTNNEMEFSYHHCNVPYNIDFTLSSYVRNMDDGLQIVEQILPYFTPEFTVTIKPGVLSDSYEKLDIPIVLTSVTTEERAEGSLAMEKTRFISWDMVFTAKMMIYGPVKTSPLIQDVEANIFRLED